jgi:hypothetical protein
VRHWIGFGTNGSPSHPVYQPALLFDAVTFQGGGTDDWIGPHPDQIDPDVYTVSQNWESTVGGDGDVLISADGDPDIPYFHHSLGSGLREVYLTDQVVRTGIMAVRQHVSSEEQGDGQMDHAFNPVYRQPTIAEGEEFWAGAWIYYPTNFDFAPHGWGGKILRLYPFDSAGNAYFNTARTDYSPTTASFNSNTITVTGMAVTSFFVNQTIRFYNSL